MEKVKPGSMLTLDERKRIKEYLQDGNYSYMEIAKMMSRAKTTVNREVLRNGGRKNYDPEGAHRRMYERLVVRQEQNVEKEKKYKISFLEEIRNKLQMIEEKLDKLIGDL